jgi:hypothetical protein
MSFSSAARRALRPVGTMAAAFALASCSSKILAVDTPDVLSDNALGGSLGATTLRNGSLQDFVVAFSGATDGFVVSTANMADEIQTTDSLIAISRTSASKTRSWAVRPTRSITRCTSRAPA